MRLRFGNATAASLMLLCLGACSFAPLISKNGEDYNATVEEVTSNLLVTNILRARDGAPLFFSDISQIRGSISANLTAQASFPFGPRNRPPTGTGVRDIGQGTLSIISNPTFDVAPSNTKQFYQGILQPLSKDVLAYFLARGITADWLLNLMVSRVEIVHVKGDEHTITKTVDWFGPDNTASQNFTRLVKEWTVRSQPRVIVSTVSSNYGPPVPADARAIVGAKAADLDAEATSDGMVQFKTHKNRTHICVAGPAHGYVELFVTASSVARAIGPDEKPKSNEACSALGAEARPDKSADFTFYRARTRSVESMFYYLGSLLRYGGRPPIPFYIREGAGPGTRFSVNYREGLYSVHEFEDKGDATLIFLAILNDLLNINRDANEIPTTKAVQGVGG